MTASFENAEKMTGDHIDVSDLMLLGAGRTAGAVDKLDTRKRRQTGRNIWMS